MDVVAFQRLNQQGENWPVFYLLSNELIICLLQLCKMQSDFRFRTHFLRQSSKQEVVDFSLQYDSEESSERVKESHPDSRQGRQ